jgi:hypothetical protein
MHFALRIHQTRREVPSTTASKRETREDWQSFACVCAFSATGLTASLLLGLGLVDIGWTVALDLGAIVSLVMAIGLGWVVAALAVKR